MAYTPTTWEDRILEHPMRFQQVETATSGVYDLVAVPGTIAQEGTPQIATNFNHMEQGIEDVTDDYEAHAALKASDTVLGHVKVDADTIDIDANGVISAGTYMAKIEAGSYTGNGVASRDITTNFTPKLVILQAVTGSYNPIIINSTTFGRAATTVSTNIKIITNGFEVGTDLSSNVNGVSYEWTILG